MGKTISQQWAEYAAALSFSDLPPAAVTQAKRFLLDSIGCALGGFHVADCRIARQVIAQMGGVAEATVIAFGDRTNAVNAAFLNSLMIRSMDYNDVYWKQDPSHPSDLIPAALSLGERQHSSGQDVITAIIIAYDLEMRLCEAAFPGIREIGWHHASLTQLASPVVAGKILGLQPEQYVNAIGISGSHNLTLGAVTAGHLTMMKNTVDPMATQSGVFAALLAQHGYIGPEAIFEGKEGLFAQLGVRWEPERLVAGLGRDFKIVDCSMKPYPSEALTHSPITATLQLVHQNGLRPDDIELVEVQTIARAADILSDPSKYEITSKETADHSLPYCLAAAIADRELTPRQFQPDKLSDPRILNLVPKISVRTNEEFEQLFPSTQSCEVAIWTRSGRFYRCRVDYPKGDPRHPLTDEELKHKFASLAEGVLSTQRQHAVVTMIEHLESLADIGHLMSALVADEASA